MQDKLLITGGTGLIGQALLAKLEYQVTILTRDAEAAKALLGTQHHYIQSLSELNDLSDFAVIINLAGEPIVNKRWTRAQKDKIEQSRWGTTEQLVGLIEKSESPPSLFISGSAIGIYGRQDSQEISEDYTYPHEEYSRTLCKKWEDIALKAKSSETRVCLLRTGIVLSKHGGALSKMETPFKMRLGGRIGSGEQIMSWIHIEDMVNGIKHLIENDKCNGAFNFVAPNAVSNQAFSQAYAKSIKKPCLLPMPAFVLKLMMGEMSDLLIYGQNVKPTKLLQYGFRFHYPELTYALSEL